MSVFEHAPSLVSAFSTSTAAIDAVDLAKTYGKGDKAVAALSGVSFSVPCGSVLGLLGPNGAGKSTTVKILTTLSRTDSGRASVAGVDVQDNPSQVRRAIGYVPQKACFDPMSTGRENLVLQGHIYGMSGRDIRSRADELLERFGLGDAAGRLAGTWSGGMQRKLDVALALIHRPHVLFLDEPTTGLDPEARADMWKEISRLARTDGLTVLLTTHYLEEADHLADHLVIIDRGRVVAAGSPGELKGQLDGDAVHIDLVRPDDAESARRALADVPGVRDVRVDRAAVYAQVASGAATLPALLDALQTASIELASVMVARPSLDEVYLRHAGRAYRATDEATQGVAA